MNNVSATEAKFDVHEVGTIVAVRECIVKVKGLPSCINGQIVEFEHGGKGIVLGFNEEEVQVLVLNTKTSLHVGEKILSKGEFLHLPVGDKFVGRIVNGLCEPVDNDGPIEADAHFPVFTDAPASWIAHP